MAFNPPGGGTPIAVKDEGITITPSVSSFDFVGSGVAATAAGNDVTVTVSGGGPVTPAYLLLADGASFFLLADGTSKLKLSGT